MIVKENIDFKRGQSSKRALNVGRFSDDPNRKWFHEEALERGYKEVTPANYPQFNNTEEIYDLAIYEKGIIQLHLYSFDDSDFGNKQNTFFIKTIIDNGESEIPGASYEYSPAVGEWINNDYYWDYAETLANEGFPKN